MVLIISGCAELSSIFWRSLKMCTMTVLDDDGRYFSCHIFSYKASRDHGWPLCSTRKNKSAYSLSVSLTGSPFFVTILLNESMLIFPTVMFFGSVSSLPLYTLYRLMSAFTLRLNSFCVNGFEGSHLPTSYASF